MPSLMTIRHVTTYRYRLPVAFGEHRMMLRPRESLDQRVIEASLQISPQPSSLRFAQDSFGNHIGIAQFSRRSKELCFESIVCLEHLPAGPDDFEFDDIAGAFCGYSADEMPDLARYIERHDIDPENRVAHWVGKFCPGTALRARSNFCPKSRRASKTLSAIEGAKQRESSSRRKHSGLATAAVAISHCLLIEAARSLGFAARFASGYLAIPLDDLGRTEKLRSRLNTTHGLKFICRKQGGSISTRHAACVGTWDLVTVAVARDPRHTTPLHGTFVGRPSDLLEWTCK